MLAKKILCRFSIFTPAVFVLLFSCNTGKVKPDPDDLSIPSKFMRFEADLFQKNREIDTSMVAGLRKQYPGFFDLYCRRIIHIPSETDSAIAANLNLFTRDPDVMAIYSRTDSVFTSMERQEKELMDMLKYYHYYFPGNPVPDVITYISAFNYTVITTDSALGIGLDMYLGKDCAFYPALGLPKYMTDKLTREYMVRDAIKAIYQSEYDPDEAGNDFLSQIIYNGKLLYFTNLLAPEMHDTIITGYSKNQLEWCRQNERNIWGFMIENDLLYSKEPSRYIRYINDGNTTQGLPKEAPAKLGVWIGWKIIQAYVEKHPDVNPELLFKEKDAQKILSESGYKPG